MGKKNDSKMKAYAAWMKDHGITRKSFRCGLCLKMVPLTASLAHYKGATCSPRRKNIRK